MGDPHARAAGKDEAGKEGAGKEVGRSAHAQAFVPATTIAQRVEQAWTELARASHDRKHGFHLPTLCTLDSEGLPTARVVVLRRAMRERAMLLAHTDVRSDKARALLAQHDQSGACCMVFYDGAKRLQLRVRGVVTLHTQGPLALMQWTASTLSSRRCYLAPHAPGSVQEHDDPNLPEHLRGTTPTSDEARAGRENFAVLACSVRTIDMLHLGAMGHSRCRWRHDENGDVRGEWVSP
jgi:hypothetical protein